MVIIISGSFWYILKIKNVKDDQNENQTTEIDLKYELRINIDNNKSYVLEAPCIVDFFRSTSLNDYLEVKEGIADFFINNITDITNPISNSSLYINGKGSILIQLNITKLKEDNYPLPYDSPELSLKYVENNTIFYNSFLIYFKCSNISNIEFQLEYFHSRIQKEKNKIGIHRFINITINNNLINGWQKTNATITGAT